MSAASGNTINEYRPSGGKPLEDVLRDEGVLFYNVKGVSMRPLIRQESDIVVIRRPEGPLKKHDVVLFRRGGDYVLHRVLEVRGKTGGSGASGAGGGQPAKEYVICGDNQWRKETGITDGDVLGVMTGLIRYGREIPLDTPAYRRYVFLWCGLFPLRAAILRVRVLPGRVLRRLERIFG